MKNTIIKLLTNLKIQETEPIYDNIKRFIAEEDFNIIINGITIFFDNNKTFNKITFIEINEDSIAFRSEVDLDQTTFAIFNYEDIKYLEFKINNNYHYFYGDDYDWEKMFKL